MLTPKRKFEPTLERPVLHLCRLPRDRTISVTFRQVPNSHGHSKPQGALLKLSSLPSVCWLCIFCAWLKPRWSPHTVRWGSMLWYDNSCRSIRRKNGPAFPSVLLDKLRLKATLLVCAYLRSRTQSYQTRQAGYTQKAKHVLSPRKTRICGSRCFLDSRPHQWVTQVSQQVSNTTGDILRGGLENGLTIRPLQASQPFLPFLLIALYFWSWTGQFKGNPQNNHRNFALPPCLFYLNHM